jgi:hypothetical protein
MPYSLEQKKKKKKKSVVTYLVCFLFVNKLILCPNKLIPGSGVHIVLVS